MIYKISPNHQQNSPKFQGAIDLETHCGWHRAAALRRRGHRSHHSRHRPTRVEYTSHERHANNQTSSLDHSSLQRHTRWQFITVVSQRLSLPTTVGSSRSVASGTLYVCLSLLLIMCICPCSKRKPAWASSTKVSRCKSIAGPGEGLCLTRLHIFLTSFLLCLITNGSATEEPLRFVYKRSLLLAYRKNLCHLTNWSSFGTDNVSLQQKWKPRTCCFNITDAN